MPFYVFQDKKMVGYYATYSTDLHIYLQDNIRNGIYYFHDRSKRSRKSQWNVSEGSMYFSINEKDVPKIYKTLLLIHKE